MKKAPLIKLDQVSFRYGSTEVLHDITHTIEEGEYLGLIGPNGGGKTTLVKLLLGLLTPTSGTITILGSPARSFKKRWQIGYVPQRVALAEQLFPTTVEEVVASGQIVPATQSKAALEEALRVTNLLPLRYRLLSTLSGGERQRTFIARALAAKPRILILDEPTTGVDQPSQDQFYQFLSSIRRELKLTLILVSHDLDVVAREVDHLLCLNRTLVCHGSPETLMKESELQGLYGHGVQRIHHHHA